MAQAFEHEQLTGEVIQVGTIVSVDHAARSCTVEIGDLVTGALPWFALFAGRVRLWLPPAVGEQCAVLCPEGDLANGLVLPGLYCDAHPAPAADPDLVHLAMPDGAVISYDHAAHALAVTLPAGGTAAITAPGGVTIEGDVAIRGNLSIEGTAEATQDVIGAGKSLKAHKHTGVAAGSAQSGPPA